MLFMGDCRLSSLISPFLQHSSACHGLLLGWRFGSGLLGLCKSNGNGNIHFCWDWIQIDATKEETDSEIN